MFRHELYKILSRKSIYVLLVITIATVAFASTVATDSIMNNHIFTDSEETLGGPTTVEKVEYAREKMRESDEEGEKNVGPADDKDFNSIEQSANIVHFLTVVAGMQSDEMIEEKKSLQREMTKHDLDTFSYKVAEKKFNMLEELGQPYGYYVIQAWRGMNTLIEPVLGSMFIIILILIGLTPVFSDEHTQRTASLIAATKHGKRKNVTAKIMASLTYIFCLFLILNVANTLIHWNIHGGFTGWDAPTQSFIDSMMSQPIYKYSPFNWKIWETYAITLAVQFFASAIISILVLFLSSRVKNTMIVFFTSGAIITFPTLITALGLDRFQFFKFLKDFSYLELLRADGLFSDFKAYNLFGNPVLYPILIIFLFGFITIGILILTYYGISKQEINE